MGWSLDLGSYQRKAASNIPNCLDDLISNDNMICRLLNTIYSHDHNDIRNVQVKQLSPGSDIKGNLSDCGRLAITVTTYGGARHEYNWFVKIQPEDHLNSDLVTQFNLFENEVEFYQKIVPELEEFVAESKIGGSEISFDIPKLIYSEVEKNRAIIILEDLVEAGFKQTKDANGDKYLSRDAAILAVESVAKIHAASYALQVKKNIDLGHIHPNLEVSGMLWSNDEMASRLTVMKDYYCDILEESKKPDSPVLVERFRKTFDSPEKLKEIVTRRVSQEKNGKSSIHCLQQGDFHFNNLMFRVEKDGRTSVKIVDWQMAYTGRAGGDIAYLLMSSINPELYETEEDAIKEKYFEMFNETFYSLIREKKWMNKEEKVEEMLELDYAESLPISFLFSCGNVMSNGERERQVTFAYNLCNEAASRNLI